MRLGSIGRVADEVSLDSTKESEGKVDPDIGTVEDSTPVNSKLSSEEDEDNGIVLLLSSVMLIAKPVSRVSEPENAELVSIFPSDVVVGLNAVVGMEGPSIFGVEEVANTVSLGSSSDGSAVIVALPSGVESLIKAALSAAEGSDECELPANMTDESLDSNRPVDAESMFKDVPGLDEISAFDVAIVFKGSSVLGTFSMLDKFSVCDIVSVFDEASMLDAPPMYDLVSVVEETFVSVIVWATAMGSVLVDNAALAPNFELEKTVGLDEASVLAMDSTLDEVSLLSIDSELGVASILDETSLPVTV